MSPHLKGACWRIPLGWYFTSPTLHDIQHGMHESPRISRGENTDQFSIRSSSVLTALRAPNVRFPTLRHALLLLLLLLLPACLLCQLPYRGRCLPMKYLMQFRFTPFFFKKNFGGRVFFNAPSGHRTPIANSGGICLIPYTTEAQQLTVLSKYNNTAHNNCNLFAHNC